MRWFHSASVAPATPVAGAGAEPAPSGPRAALVRHGLLLVAAALLVLHSLRFNFVTDDAYISFVYARNLAEHGELTFNLGDRVEGYSNFSWTVLLAALQWLGADPELTSRVLGTACGVAALALTARLCERLLGPGSWWASLPPLLLALSSGFACWSSGGLETQLFTLLCLSAFAQLARALQHEQAAPTSTGRAGRGWLGLGAVLGAAALTRPEGLLLTAVVLGVLLLDGARELRPAQRPWLRQLPRLLPGRRWLALAAFLALWAPHLAWRLWYYGWPFPNTYYVKAHGPWQPPELAAQMWRNGAHYLWTWLWQTGLVWVSPLVLAGLGWARASGRMVPVALLAFAAAYLFYAASVGGDFMGLHRFISPLFPIAALGLALGLARGAARGWLPRRAVIALTAALVLAFGACQAQLTARSLRPDNLAADRGIDTPAFLIAYTRDRAAIGRALRPCLRPDDFSVVGGAGAQPYFAGMRAIDVFGLVSARVAHQEPRTRARAGHTKWASEALILEHSPTFLFACYALHRDAAPPSLPCAAPYLARGYQLVTMHIPELAQSGTYYTFLALQRRAFACPGVVAAPGGG